LAVREASQSVTQGLVFFQKGSRNGSSSLLGSKVATLHITAAIAHLGEIDNRSPQVRAEALLFAKVGEPAERPDEGVLREILGRFAATGKEVREAAGFHDVLGIEISQPLAFAAAYEPHRPFEPSISHRV
jgi:hypothetical protein